MAKKNKGWDYLNSNDVNTMSDGNEGDWWYTASDGSGSFHGGDGSWGYKYADGSGSYHGADGSRGYKYADGSGSYQGADGSWGYKYADGSCSYHGADGSRGYKYADGSGSYQGADGSWGYKYADGSGSYHGGSDTNDSGYCDSANDNSSSSDLGELIGAAIGAGFVGVMTAIAKKVADERERKARQEAEQRERARINREKRRTWRKKHRKGLNITVFIFIVVFVSLVGYYEFQKLIYIGYSSESLKGLRYTEAVQKLIEVGFTNVHTEEISDLTISRDIEENLVTEVKLASGNSFDEYTKYPSNLPISVVYHTVKLFSSPLTSKEAKGMNYLDAIKKFEDAGFINVTTNIEYDIITGWLTDDGEVKSVTINGETKFDSYDKFRLDAEVVITYHTLKKNKPK